MALAFLLAASYVGAALTGAQVATNPEISPVWPAAGLALAALMVFGLEWWPVIWLGSFVYDLIEGTPPFTGALVALGTVAAAAAGVVMLRRARFDPSIDSLRDLALLVVLGGVLPSFISASSGTYLLWSMGTIPLDRADAAWRHWYLGDAVGVALVAPLLLTLWHRPRTRPSPERVAEFAVLTIVTATSMGVALGPSEGYPYLPFIPLVWAALRFDMRVVSAQALVASGIAVYQVAVGSTQFAGDTAPGSVLALYRFVLLLVGTAYVLVLVIEDKRRTVARLASSEQQFRAAFQGSPTAMMAVEMPGRTVVDVNPAFESAMGWTRAEVVGRPAEELGMLSDDDRRRLLTEPGAPPLRNAEVSLFTSRGTRVDGLLTSTEYDLDGRPYRLIAFVDLTEYRALESRLRQAQKMEAVGRLAGGIAHDFNNTLTVISAHADLLSSDVEPGDPRQSDVDGLQSAVRSASALTRQLLAFSRQQPMRLRSISLNDAVSHAEKLLRRVIGEDVQLSVDLAPGLSAVLGDPSQVEQILMNLAVNARDAMPNGGTLSIRTEDVQLDRPFDDERRVMGTGRFVLVTVSDTGVGMDAATRQQVFEPFFTTKAFGKGTGLGLATVYGIVKQSGGYIWVDSRRGAGTTFTIFLPVTDAPVEPAVEREAAAPRLKGRVLLVEDDERVRRVMAQGLAAAGFEVRTAASGEDALALVEADGSDIDALVSDVVLPGINGRELSDRIRTLRPAVRVILVSGYTADALLMRGISGFEVLEKPFTAAALARRLGQLLESTS